MSEVSGVHKPEIEPGRSSVEMRSIVPRYQLDALPQPVTVLPLSRGADKSLYSAASTDLVKLLMASDVDAAFLDSPDRREWQVHMGDVVEELLVGVASGLISIAMWQAMVAVIKGHLSGGQNRVTLVDMKDNAGEGHWFQVEGDADTVASALANYVKGGGRTKRGK